MKPWDIYTWNFPEGGPHPAVILGTEERVGKKPKVNVVFCSSQRATRKPEIHEVILDVADGLDWPTLCKCDIIYSVPISPLTIKRGTVTPERKRMIAARVIAALGLAGL